MKTQRIGDALQSFDSARIPIKAADRVPGGNPYLGASGVVDYVDGFTHEGEFLCVAEDGANLLTRSLPIAWVQEGKFWANNHLHVLGGVNRNHLKFFQYAIELANIASFVSGSAQPKLNQASLQSIEVPALGSSNEKAIGKLLAAIDDKIATSRVVASLSKRLIRTIAKGLDKQIPLGEIAVRNKSSFNPSKFPDELVIHFSIPRFDAGSPIVEPANKIKSSKLRVQQPCVLISKLNPETPRVWSIPQPSDTFISLASTEFVGLEPDRITQSQLYAATLHPGFHNQLGSLVGGTSKSHQRVKPDEMLKCLVPDVRKLSHTQIRLLEALNCLEAQEVRESIALAKTRDELLPLLMSGKITVKEAEQEATAAGADIASEENEA